MSGLIDLHARLNQAQTRAGACDRRWKVLLEHCKAVQQLIESSSNSPPSETWCEMKMETSVPSNTSTITGRIAGCCSSIRTTLRTKFMKHLCRFASVVCVVLSGLILWSEMVMSTTMHSPFGILMGAYSTNPVKGSVMPQAVSFLALVYMSICMYWSLFNLNLGWAFTLQGPQQSPPSSLIFNGEYFSRLQFPLGYNFLMILNAPRTSMTSFEGLMTNITLVPVFGTSFQVYVPILMVVIALFTIFNLYARILSLFGIQSDEPSGGCCCFASTKNRHQLLSEEDMEKYETGKSLIMAELRVTPNMNSPLPASGASRSNRRAKEADESRDSSSMNTSKGKLVITNMTTRHSALYNDSDLADEEKAPPREFNTRKYTDRKTTAAAPTASKGGKRGSQFDDLDDDSTTYDFTKYIHRADEDEDDIELQQTRTSSRVVSGGAVKMSTTTTTKVLGSQSPVATSSTSSSWFSRLGVFDTGKPAESSQSPIHNALPSSSSTASKAPATGKQSKSFYDMLDDDDDSGGGRYG
jgi:hypothetical protein